MEVYLIKDQIRLTTNQKIMKSKVNYNKIENIIYFYVYLCIFVFVDKFFTKSSEERT